MVDFEKPLIGLIQTYERYVTCVPILVGMGLLGNLYFDASSCVPVDGGA